jgi:outer membrane protein insertion porin family
VRRTRGTREHGDAETRGRNPFRVSGSPPLRGRLLNFLFACVLLAASNAGAQEDFQGATVQAIRFETDVKFDTGSLLEMLAVQVGKPLSIRDVQSSIEVLYGTGDFRDIVVDAAGSGVDVALTFRLSIHYRITEIVLEGFDGERQRAQRELVIRRGDVLSLDAVDRSAIAIQEALRRRGFLEAVVDPETRFQREENRAEVIFHATLGPQAKVAAIQLEGSLAPFTEAELIAAMGRKIGSEYRADRSRSDGEKLQRFLINKDHRRAEVRFLDAPYDPETDTVRLRYRVNVGPKVRVEVTGVERSRVRRWIPFRRNEGYSGDVVERARDRIVSEFQRRGHFFVIVEVAEEMIGDAFVLTYKIEPGQRYRLDDIEFDGNVKVSDSKLEDLIATRVGGFRGFLASLVGRPSGVTQQQLDDDRDAVEAYYRLQGFTEAKIGQPVAKGAADGTLDVRFPIVEGTQTLVSDVIVEGNEKIPAERLPELQLRVGDPLNPLLLRNDLVALQTHYSDLGYVEAQVTHLIEFTPDKSGARLRFRIAEGPRVRLDEVLVQGNSYTQREVILKKSRLQRGDPFSYRSLLEAQRNLYRLGIFQRVELIPQPGGTAVAERDLLVQVDEGRNLTVSGSVGWNEAEGLSGSAAISHRNLFGTARYAGIDALYAEKRRRYAASYQEPFIFGYDIPVQLTLFKGEEEREPADGFVNFDRLGTFIEATRVVGEQTEWSLRYEYRLVECVVQNPAQPDPRDLCAKVTSDLPIPGLPREDQEIQISSVSPTFFWDRRNDPINPTRGFFASASVEYAFPLFRAETNFVKGFTQGAWYRPLSERSLLAFSGRIGVIEPLKPADERGGVVPFAERFLAGGETTHRAFKTDSLGILCEDDPAPPGGTEQCGTLIRDENGRLIAIGGKALVLLSAEYRFPLFASLGGSVFVDGGNVFADSGDVFDVGEFRWGVGTGLRYLTPIGPVRLDIGFKLDRKEGEDPYATFLSLGYAF